MPTITEKKNTLSNKRMADYVRADSEFVEGIRRGMQACKEGKVKRWSDIKKELNIS